ncbi:Bromodomain-containing protein [Thozetella sp. PMI_491]|nr:Bromodomain-containing protein [Thozetella sp. PMI_491]
MSTEAPPDTAKTPVKDDDGTEPNKSSATAPPATTGEAVKEAAEPRTERQPTPPPRPFTWLGHHPIFVILLVGPEELPFAIQKNFLCFKSRFYRRYFSETDTSQTLEHLVRLPETPSEVFAYAQNFMYTGRVFPSVETMPHYDVLIGVWKLGQELGIDDLCDATLDAMTERRQVTQEIPATPLLILVWQDTPKGSSIRKLLLSWAAEYVRTSDTPNDFVDTLPKEILSELVVAIADASPPVQAAPGAGPSGPAARSVHYLDDVDDGARKRQRPSEVAPNGSGAMSPRLNANGRKPLPAKPVIVPTSSRGGVSNGRRRSGASLGDQNFNTAQKMGFCTDLLARMLSGPGSWQRFPLHCVSAANDILGFWTRLVGPFKAPVDPGRDGVPDYFDKVTRPMDLGTMKEKMDRGEYADEEAFLADMNQIFENCYTYWKKGDPMWASCEKLQKTFQEKYSQMHKWISKLEGEEGN